MIIKSYDEGVVRFVNPETLPDILTGMIEAVDDALSTDGFIICFDTSDQMPRPIWGLATGSLTIENDSVELDDWIRQFKRKRND